MSARVVPASVPAPLARVGALIRSAHRRLVRTRLAETALLGLAGWLGLLATAAWQGALGPSALLASSMAAFAGAGAYWMGASVERLALARGLDRRLACNGGLLTAYECATRTTSPALAALLAEDLCARLSRREVLHASAPSALPFLALPLVALAMLVFARERSAGESQSDWIVRLSVELQHELALAREVGEQALAEGALDQASLTKIVAAEARAAATVEEVRQGSAGAERVHAVAKEIGALLAALGTQSAPRSEREAELAAALARARETSEAAALGLAGEAGETSVAGVAAESERSGGDAELRATENASGSGVSAHAGTGEAATSGASSANGLEKARAGETMAASQSVETLPPPGTFPVAEISPDGASQGVVAARSWHAHQASIVQRWIDSRRRASLDDPGPDPTSEGE